MTVVSKLTENMASKIRMSGDGIIRIHKATPDRSNKTLAMTMTMMQRFKKKIPKSPPPAYSTMFFQIKEPKPVNT